MKISSLLQHFITMITYRNLAPALHETISSPLLLLFCQFILRLKYRNLREDLSFVHESIDDLTI